MAVVDSIVADFRSIADGTNLSADANWNVTARPGSQPGRPQSDTHGQHAGGQVIDMSNVGITDCMYLTDTLSDDDMHVELFWFPDSYTDSQAPNATVGVFLRSDSTSAASWDGYEVTFEAEYTDAGSGLERRILVEIWEVTGAARTSILSQTTAIASNEGVTRGVHKCGGSIVGNTITSYVDGLEISSVTDSTHSTGKSAGFRHDRNISNTDSQPFVTDWRAYTPNDTDWYGGDVANHIVQETVYQRDGETTGTLTFDNTATSGNLLLLWLGTMSTSATPTITDDGTGSWTLEETLDGDSTSELRLWSKVSNGDENTITITYGAAQDFAFGAQEFASGYSLETTTTGLSTSTTSTGTLSSDQKLGLTFTLQDGNTATTSKPIPRSVDRQIFYNFNAGEVASGAVNAATVTLFGEDLGTATTAFNPVIDASAGMNGGNILAVVAKSEYARATGGAITTDGTYVYHTFTEDGTFTPDTSEDVDYLVVAGGGGAWWSTTTPVGVGGGGGGGVLSGTDLTIVGGLSESWTGTDNDPWPSRFTEQKSTGASSASTIQGNEGRQAAGGTVYSTQVDSFDEQIPDNFEILVSYALGSAATNEQYAWLAFRCQDKTSIGTYTPNNCYRLEIEGNVTQSILLVKRDGTATGQVTLDSATLTATPAAGEKWWLRLSADGSALKGRTWKDGDAEPGTWDVEATDATYTDGDFLFGMTNGGSTTTRSVDWDDFALSSETTVTVGAGGDGGSTPTAGEDSSLGAITADGGGLGGYDDGTFAGSDGGSGGGTGGNGTTIYQGTVGQGNDGGDSFGTGENSGGGGGGGAGAAGADATAGGGGDGGDGVEWPTGSGDYYGGGGGGSDADNGGGAGGLGGGGEGGDDSADGTAGVANTGGGAGGNKTVAGEGLPGGSGIVIIRYPIDPGATATPGVVDMPLGTPAPTVAAASNATATPGVVNMGLATPAPTVEAGNVTTATPGVVDMPLGTPAPTISAGGGVSVIPGVVDMPLGTPAPTIGAASGSAAFPAAVEMTLATPPPTVSGIQNQSITTDPLDFPLNAGTPAFVGTPDDTGSTSNVLGCTTEYEVILVARDGVTFAGRVPFSELTWSRVLDEISEATVVVPDVLGGLRCNVEFGSTVEPWKFGIRIEADGSEVWTGPIVSVERPVLDGIGQDFVTLTCQDKMAWTTKRVIPTNLVYEEDDVGTAFKGVLDGGMSLDNVPQLYCPEVTTGFAITRNVVSNDYEYAYDILTEMADASVDYFMVGSKLAVFDVGTGAKDPGWWYNDGTTDLELAETPDVFGRFVYGLFTAEAWTSRPGYVLDGFAQANDVVVPGADSGEAGFRRSWRSTGGVDLTVGLLTSVEVAPLYRPQADDAIEGVGEEAFQELADSTWAARNIAPVVISGGALSQTAPITKDTMFPGSLWALDMAEEGIEAFLAIQRLKRVDVTVTATDQGIQETVSPTLIPIGSDPSVQS